jgi:hypothetical protein
MNPTNPITTGAPATSQAATSGTPDISTARTLSDATYVVQPGTLQRDDWLRWSNWVPTEDQIGAAARLNIADAVDPWERGAVTVTMRQGLGMIVVLGLIAGVIPLIANLWLGLSMQTSVPLAQAANSVAPLTTAYPADSPISILGTMVQTIAGLPPRMPGVLAAILSALGLWISTPINWLTAWIVYGLFVFGLARLMGASNTLQGFYAATSFAAVPLVLMGLGPIPWIGPLLMIAALVLALVVYYKAMRYVTRLDGGRTLLCMLLPLAVGVVLPLLGVLGGIAASLLPIAQPM